MSIIVIDWEEIEHLVLRAYSFGRGGQYKKLPVPEIISQSDVRRMSDALAYLMMGGKAPKLKRSLRYTGEESSTEGQDG